MTEPRVMDNISKLIHHGDAHSTGMAAHEMLFGIGPKFCDVRDTGNAKFDAGSLFGSLSGIKTIICSSLFVLVVLLNDPNHVADGMVEEVSCQMHCLLTNILSCDSALNRAWT